jgi:hypothetical protein
VDDRDALEARARTRSVRSRLAVLAETTGWVHHVADSRSGEVASTSLDRPVTALSRARRLERLGHRFAPPFLGPSFHLTSRAPYQASPEGYLVAINATFSLPFDDTIVWDVPADHGGSPLLGLDAYFLDSPQDVAVLTLRFAAKAWAGRTGGIELIAFRDAQRVQVPIGAAFAEHTVDLAVPPPGPRFLDTAMTILPGVELLRFRSLSFRAGIVIEGVLADF